ncbi:hypothetical protein ACI5KX_09385 [Erythrobacter sp. GH1-10]|uniref:hypothetical protein n=1 Tax=Erythrobacter sp. GH1-10 TaxID=3349334 RepID=UPI003877CAB8
MNEPHRGLEDTADDDSRLALPLPSPSSKDPSTLLEPERANETYDGVRIFDQVSPIAPLQRANLERLDLANRLEVLQAWEGVVTFVDEEEQEFTARLFDLTDSEGQESQAVFDMSDVSLNDRDLLQNGGVFQWSIGYRRHRTGQIERVSAITFRRLPAWLSEDIHNARHEADRLAASFSIE